MVAPIQKSAHKKPAGHDPDEKDEEEDADEDDKLAAIPDDLLRGEEKESVIGAIELQ